MDDESQRNVTTNGTCISLPTYVSTLAIIDAVTILMGQPMTVRLLWVTLTSKRSADVLNLNLALFHSVHYLISNLHLFILFFCVRVQGTLLKLLYVFVQAGGPMNLTFICLERYIAVIHPTCFPLLKTYRCREVCAAAVWLCSLPVAVLNIFTHNSLSDVSEAKLRKVSYVIMMSMIVIMMYSSITVARTLRHPTVGKDVPHPVKKRAFITIMVTAYTALFCYIPVTLMQMVETSNPNRYTCVAAPLSIFFLSAAGLVHPLFYLSTQGQLCSCCKRDKKHK